MLKAENIEVTGFGAAIRGMRNPMNSWDKSDSVFIPVTWCDDEQDFRLAKMCGDVAPVIKKNDLGLMKSLAKAGDDHGKYLRMINITMDITAPRYWWAEYDTYKVGTVANSCSTMHKIHEKEFTLDDFSHEHLDEDNKAILSAIVGVLNSMRGLFNVTKQKTFWWQMIQLLPSSYNQKRTVQLNYQVAKRMHEARKNHKLDEWHELCRVFEDLPYFKEICMEETDE